MRVGRSLSVLILVTTCWRSPCLATTIEVHPGESIQAAVDSAMPGSEIVVSPGRYVENVRFTRGPLTFCSTDPEDPEVVAATIIDGSGTGPVVEFRQGGGDGSSLRGLTVTGAGERGCGVLIYSCSPTLSHCTISDNGPGVQIRKWVGIGGSSPKIENCRITRNRLGGIHGEDWDSSLVVTDCEITENRKGGGGGVSVAAATAVFVNCNISDNEAWFSMYGGGGGVVVTGEVARFVGCTISRNRTDALDGGGGILSGSKLLHLQDCVIEENRAPREAWGHGGGINATGHQVSINDCRICCNEAATEGGGLYLIVHGATIANSVLTGNRAGTNGGAIFSDAAVLTNCVVADNFAQGHGGGIYGGGTVPEFMNCTIARNRGGGMYCSWDAYPIFTNCILWNPGDEILGEATPEVTYSCVQGGFPGIGNIDALPRFVDPSGGDYRLSDGSPCVDGGLLAAAPNSDIEGNPRPGEDALVDMGAFESPDFYLPGPTVHVPTVRFVRNDTDGGKDGGSWTNAHATIGEALEVSSTSDEIWVRHGTYDEPVWMEPTVALRGGFEGTDAGASQRTAGLYSSVIDATGHGRVAVVMADRCLLDGFEITGGDGSEGGGLSCYDATCRIEDCWVHSNQAEVRGGGLYASNSLLALVGCVFSDNLVYGKSGYHAFDSEGGGLYLDSSPSTLVNCALNENTALDGAGLYVHALENETLLMNCDVSRNTTLEGRALFFGAHGGGVRGAPRMVNCVLQGNRAIGYSYGAAVDGAASMTNCLIERNSADGQYSHVLEWTSLLNCTVVGNRSRREILSNGSAVNSIFWNEGSEIAEECVVSYSYIRDSTPGEGNIADDPLFTDTELGDFTLQPNSPCIDAGSPDASFNDGCLPPGLGTVRNDMGAYGGPGNCGWESFNPPPTPTPIPSPTPTRTPFVPADIDNDLKVDAEDLLRLLNAWREGLGGGSPEDVYSDGKIDSMDLAAMQGYWYTTTGPAAP